ncbi:MAG: GNAT family N-acetyltransferase [Campylobacterota bacterium]|nr:GNAT family N-acetyltransferase [Campylobacterota bacterium]
MYDRITLSISNTHDVSLINNTYEYLKAKLPIYELNNVGEALEQLIENVLEHAYDRTYEIDLKVRFTVSSCQIQIDVEEQGIPFDFSRYLSEAIDHSSDHRKGFYRIYDLVERFYFTPMPNEGKCFTLIQPFDQCFDLKTSQVIEEDIVKERVLNALQVRSFVTGDGDGIAKLIYRNYNYTYYKNLFYEPHEVRKANESGDVHSIVAVYNDQVVGHFALVHGHYSNIAEIAVATVDPRYKQMGIMNKMFDYLIEKAKQLDFQAIYGEAIMLHPYSQKANLSHGMTECAIVLGEVPAEVEIEHKVKNIHRSGVLVSYLLFDKHPRYVTPCSIYDKAITKIYSDAKVSKLPSAPEYKTRDAVTYRINRALNVGIIRFEKLISETEFKQIFDDLLKEHCDMIYADINLHRIDEIDELITMLNHHMFFYSGVLFGLYESEDYLRLQHKNSNHIDEEQLVYYSANAKAMLEFIKQDEARVERMQ